MQKIEEHEKAINYDRYFRDEQYKKYIDSLNDNEAEALLGTKYLNEETKLILKQK